MTQNWKKQMRRAINKTGLAFACATFLSLCAQGNDGAQKNIVFIENEQIKLGMDMSSGGGICHFEDKADGKGNRINRFDRGRLIQQSYYGEHDGSTWAEKPWLWNPIQGGDYKGKPAPVLERKIEKDKAYVKSVGVHWASGEVLSDCVFEEWIMLEGGTARIKFKFTYSGNTEHPARHQELPAFFANGGMTDLYFYDGKKPWTNDTPKVRKDLKEVRNEYAKPTENWAAYIGADGRGIGLYFPASDEITYYRCEHPDKGETGVACSYFAPISTLSIKPGFTFEYEIFVKIGTLKEIREKFYSLHSGAAAANAAN